MSYKVIHRFTDLQDFNHLYNVGDLFPRIGMKVSQSRIDELASGKNKLKTPLIELEKDKKIDNFSQYMNEPEKTTETEYTKTEINRMSTADLKELAEKNGLDNSLSGAELKKLLINHYGL
jgi:hypothetical protein